MRVTAEEFTPLPSSALLLSDCTALAQASHLLFPGRLYQPGRPWQAGGTAVSDAETRWGKQSSQQSVTLFQKTPA